ncbi:hypothetical protein MSAN_01940600 [Mycena sanguinolenta]|uniref:Nephrocystin 3-like N-terminal domain-containing protein n=1 Tax=Mycena sanguinolenta TaxID=230812 RepID=A0A8H6XQN1_9AGAR|nr:hypothetical protein MSAN_01940600 [Mycena sanguinolenta]
MNISSDALQSTFQRALYKYIASLPEKKKKRRFIVACCATTSSPVTPDSINEAIQKVEQEHAKRPGMRTVQKILSPIVTALQDYDCILNALTSADPMPTALIWGALKIVIDGAHRFIDLFDTIKKELNLLAYQIQRINSYDRLYGEYDQLQKLFCYKSLLKAATSFSTAKLKNIVKDIEEDAERIEKFADILEATEGKAERRAAELERFRAENARVAAQAEWDAQAAWREQDEKYKQEERYHKVSAWLRADQANEDDTRQLHIHKNQHLCGTCEWVFKNSTYLAWRDGVLQPSIIWAHAPAAAGKSVLSAHLIHTLTESLGTDGAVAYHFYRFDQTHTSCEILCLLASQLLDAHWVRTHSISEDIYSKTQQNARARSPEIVQGLIQVLVSLLPKTYFILDGLDEECKQTPRWQEAAATIDFLAKLPDRVRLWCSSQIRPCISDKLKAYSAIDIQDSAKHDVAFYLSRDNPELNDLEVSDQDKDAVLKSLRERAGVNFLWASVMIRSLKEETTSLADMKQFVRDGLPETLDEYYRRSFERFAKTQRPLVSKVFALVAFARRPLRIGEVCEAVGLMRGKNPRSLRAEDMPFPSSLRALLPPLMEFPQEGCSKPDECICRLFHSTVREFLLRNPAVLRSGLDDTSDVLITPDVIGNACLLYLSQSRYSRLLTRNNDSDWVDASNKPVDQHQFHVYAAKYWDKHLDEIPPTDVLHRRVSAFITSANFETCVQVQSLWVDAQFGVWLSLDSPSECRAYLRRMFPKWFVTGSKEGKGLWLNFRVFVHEWKHFLRGPNMEPSPTYLPYKGELDRCWWPTLGPRNFLSKLKCKYTAFAFQKDQADPFSRTGYYQSEGVGADGTELVILKLKSRADSSLVFALERWACLENCPPTLQRTQTIVTTEKDTNWRSYVKGTKANIDRARAIVFSASNDFLRIGGQLFSRDDMGDYIPIPGFSPSSQSPPAYIEEFAVRGDVIALANRRGSSVEKMHHAGLPDDSLDLVGADLLHMEETSNESRAQHKVESDSESDFASESTDTSSTDSEDMGHETWSECSTEYSDDFGDDHITPWAGPVSDLDEDSDSDGDAFLKKALKVELKEDEENQGDYASSPDSESSSDESDLDPAAIVGYGRWHDDNEDHAWSDSDAGSGGGHGRFVGTRSLARNGRFLVSDVARRDGPMASITIFSQTSTGTPTRLFHFTRSIPFPLYDSPPAFHPSKSLVVWPLSAGDVLFADYHEKTYFVRKLRPSTLHTRHVFVKCHFSPCGSYIHFACFEGQKEASFQTDEEAPRLG